ncbi:MAG: D-2-hydroxyacid dehydrogenase [Eubacterium sp.]|nr:D-2-hydroxyacid dehydrogenase [Eubacterium sp.]
MKKILVTIDFEQKYRDTLNHCVQQFPDLRLSYKSDGLSPEDLKGVNAIIGCPGTKLLQEADSLEWLQLTSAGADKYCAPGILPQGCVLTNASGAYGLSVSDHMLAMTFSLMRNFPFYSRQQGEHDWKRGRKVQTTEGAVVVLLGVGDIGSIYGRKMKALGAYTIGVRRTIHEKPEWLDEQITMEELDKVLPRADFVAMSLPGGKATEHIIDERRLGLMKDTAYIINVGRGNAIDPAALKKALREGTIGGAGLDVTEPEPLPADDELWSLPNCLITPHVAGWFFLDKTVERIIEIVCQNLDHYMNGKELNHKVNIKYGY